MPPRIDGRRALVWSIQGLLVVALVVFVGRTVSRHWEEFRSLEWSLSLRPGWIGLAAAVVLLTYGLLIAAWRLAVVAWGEPLRFAPAVRIWTLSNLGRYLPGKIWSVAGLAVLVQREGVAGWAGVGAAIAMQALAIGSGVAVAAATTPGAISLGGLMVAAVMALVTIAALTARPVSALLARLARQPDFRPLPMGAVVLSGAVTATGWAGYGVAFWCLARGTIGPSSLGLGVATGVFAAGYLAGLLALFAPGGVGVREAVFIGLLTPSVGPGGAVVLAAASRLLLTITEVTAAGLGLVLARRGSGDAPAGRTAGRAGDD